MEAKIKTFDAVEMSRRLRKKSSRALEAMTPEQRLAALRQARERFCARRATRLRAGAA
jgi:hypothetical protein